MSPFRWGVLSTAYTTHPKRILLNIYPLTSCISTNLAFSSFTVIEKATQSTTLLHFPLLVVVSWWEAVIGVASCLASFSFLYHRTLSKQNWKQHQRWFGISDPFNGTNPKRIDRKSKKEDMSILEIKWKLKKRYKSG